MNDGQSAKQQIIDKIKSSSNILVTVSESPSVDQLSAALGMTIMLNNMNKHATAVVSGAIPPAITFLDPEKTFENTVDSLRDFIIALDKEKADHLRYKVDGDVVKIFITPYRTTISEEDLDFSQGDYNVELVLALGVQTQDNLDTALKAHGRILHDATVATLSSSDPSKLGSIDWFEASASSICEMLVSLSEALKTSKPLLDEQVSTAFLTGIVAATDRFSNDKTSSKVMTMAAQLMAAGANQQLIASKLEEAHEIGDSKGSSTSNSDGTTNLSEGESTKLDKQTAPKETTDSSGADGDLSISHEMKGDVDEVAKQTAAEEQSQAAKAAEEDLAKQLETVAPTGGKPSVADLQKDLAVASADVDTAAYEPSLGGTLNATTEEAAKEKAVEENSTRNKTILTHGAGEYVGDQKPTFDSPINGVAAEEASEPEVKNPFDQPVSEAPKIEESTPTVPAAPIAEPPKETLADLDKKNRGSAHAEAQAAVEEALKAVPSLAPAPSSSPTSTLPPQSTVPDTTGLPPLPDFSTLPPPPPPLPPLDGAAPTLPPEQLGQIFAPEQQSPQVVPPVSNDPNQFKIPGQS